MGANFVGSLEKQTNTKKKQDSKPSKQEMFGQQHYLLSISGSTRYLE